MPERDFSIPLLFSRPPATGKFSRFESDSDSDEDDDESDPDPGSTKSADSWSDNLPTGGGGDKDAPDTLEKPKKETDDNRKTEKKHGHSHRKSHKKRKSKKRDDKECRRDRHKSSKTDRKTSEENGASKSAKIDEDGDSDSGESRFKHSSYRKNNIVVPKFSDIGKISSETSKSRNDKVGLSSAVVRVFKDTERSGDSRSSKLSSSLMSRLGVGSVATKRKIEIDDSARRVRTSVCDRLGKAARSGIPDSKRKLNCELVRMIAVCG